MNEQFGIPEIENEVSVLASVPLEVRPKSVSVPASVPLEVGPESQVVPLEDRSESPMLAELPVITPLTEKSTQNVQNAFHQVISSSFSDESHETNASLENMNPRYSQRLNKGVPKKQYEPDPKAKESNLIS
ncbi:hypothetical protein GH714_008033 [Hevea brasiliensis]|uniref:Uncharacterized protein n=1 Tax=Hevea brasiliensis TaxID=3981 RepID=A0A6A6N7K8_HEVBR|nr:hypothetical protein GH714_008033 [Hevea brasiliensis]